MAFYYKQLASISREIVAAEVHCPPIERDVLGKLECAACQEGMRYSHCGTCRMMNDNFETWMPLFRNIGRLWPKIHIGHTDLCSRYHRQHLKSIKNIALLTVHFYYKFFIISNIEILLVTSFIFYIFIPMLSWNKLFIIFAFDIKNFPNIVIKAVNIGSMTLFRNGSVWCKYWDLN